MGAFKKFIRIIAFVGLIMAVCAGSKMSAVIAVVAAGLALGIAIGEWSERKK